jgi:hypothetical protein
MTFTVTWLDDATDELMELWGDAEIRQAVVDSARKIEAGPRVDPQHAGEYRPDNVRIIFEAPLAGVYEVFLNERQVNILRVWYYQKRSN